MKREHRQMGTQAISRRLPLQMVPCSFQPTAPGDVATHSTGKPPSLIIRAVPPEASSRTSFWTRPLARSSSPVLSKTDRIAGMLLELLASQLVSLHHKPIFCGAMRQRCRPRGCGKTTWLRAEQSHGGCLEVIDELCALWSFTRDYSR